MKSSGSINMKDAPAASPSMIRRFTALVPKRVMWVALAIAAAGLFAVSGAQATITMTGDVEPGTASAWPSAGTVYVGNTANGSVTINGGSTINSSSANLGNATGATGTVNIDGAGSTWTNGNLNVGYGGAGIINITNGGGLSANVAYLGTNAGSSGTVHVDGNGSSLIVSSGALSVGFGSGSGLLTVTNGATLTSGSSNNTYIGRSAAGGTVIVDGVGSKFTDTGLLYIAYGGPGALSITNGGVVNLSTSAYIVGGSSYNGTVTVGGPGSTLTVGGASNSFVLGTGTLSIINGGVMTSGTTSNSSSSVGYASGYKGNAIVDGAGSAWNAAGTLYVGKSGAGELSISDGGLVTANTVSINAASTLTTDLGYGSSLTVGGGTGTLTNNGTVRLAAGASATAGTYTPISAGTWTGTGAYQALGGVWNSTNHTVTVNAASTAGGAGGATAFISNLASAQRALVTDTALGTSVGAGFQAGSGSLAFTANSIGGAVLSSLLGDLPSGQHFLSGWTFSTTGYTTGNPVYLSLFAGTSETLSGLEIWDYNGTSWSQFAANDLAYDGTYASFTTTALNDFAVTGAAPMTGATPTPIPGALLLFGPGLAALGFLRKRIFGA